jgi:hypothetical protein
MVGKANRTMVLSREPISVPSTMIVSIIRLCGVELWFGLCLRLAHRVASFQNSLLFSN